MQKLKWWQWTLIAFFGIGVINAIANPPKPKTGKVVAQPSARPPLDPKFTTIENDIFAVTFNAAADPEALPDAARQLCGARHFCMVTGWAPAQYPARAFPMTDREVGHQSFVYRLNRDTGLEKSMWDCTLWKRNDKNECL